MGMSRVETALRSFLPGRFSGKGSAPLQETPTQFEARIAQLYESLGFEVDCTKQSRDGGVDFYARQATEAGNMEEIAVQCKLYTGTVGVEAARALYGVINDQQHLTRGVLVTSSGFSTDCQQFIAGKRIDLITGEQVQQLTRQAEAERLRREQSVSELSVSEWRTMVRGELDRTAQALRRYFVLVLYIGLIVFGIVWLVLFGLLLGAATS